MIYLTQLIYIKAGKEELFHQFEAIAIPLMEKYHGKIVQRIRPAREAFIEGEDTKPYEIHIVSFRSEADFEAFLVDGERNDMVPLKEASVEAILLVKGEKL